jgi:hypothetical protein
MIIFCNLGTIYCWTATNLIRQKCETVKTVVQKGEWDIRSTNLTTRYFESPKAIHIMSGQTYCALLIRNVETNHVLWLIVHQSASRHWQTLSNNIVSSKPRNERDSISHGTDCTSSCKFNYHTITMAPRNKHLMHKTICTDTWLILS